MRLQSRLIGWWPLIDTTGLADDYSSNNNRGTITGATRDSAGILGDSSYSFDGNDVIDMNGFSGLEPDYFTYSAWVKHTMSGIGTVYSKENDGPWTVIRVNGGSLDLSVTTSSGTDNLNAGTGLNDGTWHHIAGTYDGNNLVLYADGVSVGNSTNSSGPAQYAGDTPAIGARPKEFQSANRRFYQGNINDVRVYSRPLPPAEVNALYERGRSASYSSIKKTP